jgi:hypothetical protein
MSLIVRMCRLRTRMSDQRHRQTSMSLGVRLHDVRDLCIFDSTTRLSRGRAAPGSLARSRGA